MANELDNFLVLVGTKQYCLQVHLICRISMYET